MKNLTILVDMDDTIENLCEAWCAALNKQHNLRVKPQNIKEWDLRQSFPTLTPKQIYAPLFNDAFWDTVKPIPGAQKALRELAEDGHRLLIVTASHPETVSAKLNKVLFRYFPFLGYRDVIVASQKDVIRGDVRIDDNPENLTLVNDGSLRILFNRPHNESFNADAHNIERADDWDEIKAMVSLYSYMNAGRTKPRDRYVGVEELYQKTVEVGQGSPMFRIGETIRFSPSEIYAIAKTIAVNEIPERSVD